MANEELIAKATQGGLRIKITNHGINQDIRPGVVFVSEKWEGEPYGVIKTINFTSEDGKTKVGINANVLFTKLGVVKFPDFVVLDD